MGTPEIKRLAESHIMAVKDTVDALAVQGFEIKLTRTTHDCIFIAGEVGNLLPESFYLDNEVSIERLASVNRSLRSFIRTPMCESTSTRGAA